jgi:GGDEF domain-containing protein
MWTRNAFLQFCHVMPRDVRWVAFIDMNKIHELNEELGYTEVDRRIKETFSVPFRRSDVVARWYSGDYIVILFDADGSGAGHKIEQLVDRLFLWGKRNAYSGEKPGFTQGSLSAISL